MPKCGLCESGKTPSRDKSTCLSCSDSSVQYNSQTQTCTCRADYSYMIEDLAAGTQRCAVCDAEFQNVNNFQGPKSIPIYECRKCEGEGKVYKQPLEGFGAYECVCDTLTYTAAGDICIKNTEFAANGYANLKSSFRFENVEAGQDSNILISIAQSDMLNQLQVKAAHLCKTTGDQQ